MSKVIAITNQKGGVGKTTTCVNLAASLVAAKQRVLLIDLDPQGNATMGSGVDKHSLTVTINDILLGNKDITEAIQDTPAHFDIVPGNSDLTEAEIILLQREQREFKLQQAISTIKDNYDYILIDCPPTLNTLTINALVASDSVLIPIQCEYYALEGLASLLGTIEQVQQTVNADLQIEGLLRTMYDTRNRLATDVSAHLIESFGDKVYRTVIPRNVRLAEAPSHGLPVIVYDRLSTGAKAYMVLAGELLRKQQSTTQSDTSNTEEIKTEQATELA